MRSVRTPVSPCGPSAGSALHSSQTLNSAPTWYLWHERDHDGSPCTPRVPVGLDVRFSFSLASESVSLTAVVHSYNFSPGNVRLYGFCVRCAPFMSSMTYLSQSNTVVISYGPAYFGNNFLLEPSLLLIIRLGATRSPQLNFLEGALFLL